MKLRPNKATDGGSKVDTFWTLRQNSRKSGQQCLHYLYIKNNNNLNLLGQGKKAQPKAS
jgi:hypothetical protein